MPQRGPEPSQRMSLAIFIRLTATVLSAPLASTMASRAAWASKWLSASRNASPVIPDRRSAIRRPNSGCVFSPVPTAVPPMASSPRESRRPLRRRRPCSTWLAHPPTSWPSRIGVASCRWVRPALGIPSKASAFSRSASRR